MKSRLPFVWLACMVVLLAGCASQTRLPEDATACQAPRPEICTLDYRPVCALDREGHWRTRGNPCDACGDRSVLGWRQGPCSTRP